MVQFATTDLLSFCGLREGKKSIFRAFASFAAVRNEKFTSSCSTFVIYGLDTFIRRASSVCETPSSFIRSKICRRNADPILSMFIGFRFRVASFGLSTNHFLPCRACRLRMNPFFILMQTQRSRGFGGSSFRLIVPGFWLVEVEHWWFLAV